MAGAEVGTVELNDSIFGIEPNGAVVHEVVKNHLANCRQGTQSALTKGEVSYTTAKPWRQKGTGRARAGYKGSPVWTHGGVAFAPKPRDYSYTLNKQVKRLALKSALSAKAASESVVVVDKIELEGFKTKAVSEMLGALGAGKKAVIVMPEKCDKLVKSAANIPGVKTALINTLNTYDILNCDTFIIAQDAVSKLEEVYA